VLGEALGTGTSEGGCAHSADSGSLFCQDKAAASSSPLQYSFLSAALESLDGAAQADDSCVVALVANERLARSLSLAVAELLPCARQRQQAYQVDTVRRPWSSQCMPLQPLIFGLLQLSLLESQSDVLRVGCSSAPACRPGSA
jgi:hypothetical protein